MAKEFLGITRKPTREEQLIEVRNKIIVQLYRSGFSYWEISQIANVDKTNAFRVVKKLSKSKRST